jgi:hypothetical protein
VGREARPVEQLVGLEVRGGGRRIGGEQRCLDVSDGEGAGEDVDEVEAPAILASWRGEAPLVVARLSVAMLSAASGTGGVRGGSFGMAAGG